MMFSYNHCTSVAAKRFMTCMYIYIYRWSALDKSLLHSGTHFVFDLLCCPEWMRWENGFTGDLFCHGVAQFYTGFVISCNMDAGH